GAGGGGKAFWLKNDVTGEQWSESFTAEGHMNVYRVGANANMPSGYGNVVRGGYQGTTSPYEIANGTLVTFVSQDPYALTFYKLGSDLYAARSNEFGFANYEVVPLPQVAVNPLVDVANQFSVELGLTEPQKQQIVPLLKDELEQLAALKKETSLGAAQKVEKLRAIGVSFDEKLKPLLNADQQAKFRALREAFRRHMIEELAGKALEKVEQKP